MYGVIVNINDKQQSPIRLEVRHLSKSFGKVRALEDVSLDIPSGMTYALLGPNGSGKTTLLKSLIGIIPFDKGEVSLDGCGDIHSYKYKSRITYMAQYPGFLPHLTVKESIELLIKLRGVKPCFKEQLVNDMKIDQFWQRPFGELSGGMKQKVNILQCFMFKSDAIFLDEPTSSLDPLVSVYVKNLIDQRKKSGCIVLFTSHIMGEVEQIADKMALLNNGQILFEASPKEFILKKGSKNLEKAMLKYWELNVV